jgi:hypothetical protein
VAIGTAQQAQKMKTMGAMLLLSLLGALTSGVSSACIDSLPQTLSQYYE